MKVFNSLVTYVATRLREGVNLYYPPDRPYTTLGESTKQTARDTVSMYFAPFRIFLHLFKK